MILLPLHQLADAGTNRETWFQFSLPSAASFSSFLNSVAPLFHGVGSSNFMKHRSSSFCALNFSAKAASLACILYFISCSAPSVIFWLCWRISSQHASFIILTTILTVLLIFFVILTQIVKFIQNIQQAYVPNSTARGVFAFSHNLLANPVELHNTRQPSTLFLHQRSALLSSCLTFLWLH